METDEVLGSESDLLKAPRVQSCHLDNTAIANMPMTL